MSNLWEDDCKEKENLLPGLVKAIHKKKKKSTTKPAPSKTQENGMLWKKTLPKLTTDDLWLSTEEDEVGEDTLINSLLVQKEGKQCILASSQLKRNAFGTRLGHPLWHGLAASNSQLWALKRQ